MLRFRPIMMTTMAAMFGALAAGGGGRHGVGAAPAAGHLHRRRAHFEPASDPLYHSRSISCIRSHAALFPGQAARYVPRRPGPGNIGAGMRTNRSTVSRLGLLAAPLLFIAGCMVGPAYHTPQPLIQPVPDSYQEDPSHFPTDTAWKVASPQDALLHGKWWEIFGDPELNTLEDQLDINNQNIKVYFENFSLPAPSSARLRPSSGLPSPSIRLTPGRIILTAASRESATETAE